MKFQAKTKVSGEIPTASMPDIIFMLLIFFMVTTVLREYEGLNVFLPQARKIERLETKRHVSYVFVSKDGLISIDDKIIPLDNVKHVMYEKRVANPQITVSLKSDKNALMELISSMHNELREADALKVNYSARSAPG
ncbi:MAG: biopolymer transporter ExbD [Candidatus Marinimicrobia bacterium]|jgi:biopolymer transport protein ExbD|nr:biopolymer transporter ExbD [Candidatus Neomarinimicrobiota bacterium]MDP6457336.1 biopolymer transporter ExbD [Candidatus Neomarinimicrobiota bacterium]MDP6592591.1 biopolymer transporter ExbD [Candidatus Neomarinimicrobiota bacterium]MDP6836430.1 biopolymer transporter ExbD [Candidatus Neomarinimicrobiota bacterium]|tara:strand:- start:640 stop:1050 length:411 start_codon:yes stop_codon:yes gene_type:complete